MSFLASLDSQQRAAAECIAGPVVIYAGAGTGKTRTITHRIAHGVANGVFEPTQTLVVTFTTRAAGELRNRLVELGVQGVQVRTFHSAALRQLRYFYPQVFDKQFPTLIPSKFKFVQEAAQACGIAVGQDQVRDLAAEIEWAKVNIISPQNYVEHAKNLKRVVSENISVEQAGKVYEAYLGILDTQNAIDFEDVLLLMTAILTNYPDIADQVRRQYRHFTVDEFQDVSPAQFELLCQWLGNRTDVCVVGDPAQTIYSFSGATSDYLNNFDKHFPQVQRFELTSSYRSVEPIVAAANTVIREQASVTLQATRGKGVQVATAVLATDEAEALYVADEITRLIGSGVALRDIAVLFRTNSQSALLEAELSNRGFAFTLRGTERFFERPEIKNAVLALRTASNVKNDKSLPGLVRDVCSNLGWKSAMPTQGRSAQETWESLNALVDLADDFSQAKPDATVTDLVTEIDRRMDIEHAPTANAITLASIHSAKGLEWACVFVVGISEGLLPITHATSPAEIAEEQRLLYVAITRAKDELHLSWARSRHADSRVERKASRFLAALNR